MQRNKPPLILSVMPGIDLLGRAFEEAGFCVVRGPDVIWGGDVRTFHCPSGVFDGLISGPPCQSFSALVHLVHANGNEPKFGNLIPEYERCVMEAQPAWFLMEEVPAAPVPVVEGYAIHDFILRNEQLDSGDGFGNEQERKRRFSFGVKGQEKIDLRKWIKWAALELPDLEKAVMCDSRETPIKIGGLGKVKANVVLGEGFDAGMRPREKVAAQLGGGGCLPHTGRARPWAESCRLMGVPEDFLKHAPFTQEGRNCLLGNAVPLSFGWQLAQAVRAAIVLSEDSKGEA